MHSVKLTIEGTYWDSQIYSGELVLFDAEGGIHRIEWRDVIDQMAERNASIQTALRVAFSDSDLFYNPKVRKILCDPIIESPIKKQLKELATLAITANQLEWSSHWKTESSPFPFLPIDTDIYYHHILAGGDEGLFSVPKSRATAGKLFGKSLFKHHDARFFQIRASDRFTAVAAAAGDDGLFEFAFSRADEDVLNKSRRLAERSCSACDWAFQSVMGWTTEGAFFASFKDEKDPTTKRSIRSFDRIVEPSEMFGEEMSISSSPRIVWGCREKVYRISNHQIDVANYSPRSAKSKKNAESKEVGKLFTQRGKFDLNFDASTAIATGTAPFGTVLEFDDRLVVLRSDGVVDVFDGEPVHWRVFPRSDHYSNQLHIIYDDRLEVISFVHDYFVDQSEKLSGFVRGSGPQSSESV